MRSDSLTVWLRECAMPRWTRDGFRANGEALEELPDLGRPTRSLVQARQAYCLATLPEGKALRGAAGEVLLRAAPTTPYDVAHFILAHARLANVLLDDRHATRAMALSKINWRLVEQNPVMHLVEALLEMPRHPALPEVVSYARENFFDSWGVSETIGGRDVEPGHVYEWATLLSLCGCFDAGDMYIKAKTMTRSDHLVPARIRGDEVVDGTLRLWAQTEAYRAHLRFGDIRAAFATLGNLKRYFLRTDGTWQERLQADSTPVPQAASPASSLYHVVTAAEEESRCGS